MIRGLGRAAWVPIAVSTLAVAFPRAAPAILAVALFLFLALPSLVRDRADRPGRLAVAIALFLFACGATVFYQPGAAVDLFEDGLILAPADAYLAGGRPYLDTYPIHGWGADGGLDAILFRIFGPTLETFRFRRAAMAAFALVALAAAAGALFPRPLWGGAAFLAALCFCPFPSERHAPAFAALVFLLIGARSGRRWPFPLAGAIAACALFYSFDLGLVVLAGGLFGAATAPFLASGFRRFGSGARDATAFLGGALAASLPFALLLTRSGSLAPFFRISFFEIPGSVADAWGLPAGAVGPLLRDPDPRRVLIALVAGPPMPALFLLTVLATAATVLLLLAAHGRFEREDRVAWIALVVAAVAVRGALGRADEGHLAFYGVFAGLPAAWLVYRASRAVRGRVVLTVATVLFLLARLRPAATVSLELSAVDAAPHEREARARSGVRFPRTGRSTVPADQAKELGALRGFFDSRLAPGETFFDFGNQPALYFLLERRMPVRFTSVPSYELPALQEEVIARLERERPPLAILASGAGSDAFDGVSNRDRAPVVAAYLDGIYEPIGRVAGRTIGRRRTVSSASRLRSP